MNIIKNIKILFNKFFICKHKLNGVRHRGYANEYNNVFIAKENFINKILLKDSKLSFK